ncbi:hypothetical protein J4G71_21950 [Vibrio fluvialis]|uniref:hypothetical protein n=1 Tax=Vibrio fluvialis TaxID=676 RepID=UPI00192C2A9C|nr:hypothetical protein [Vibrio fluvialis]MBO1536387.1 hypothetical protein [Vibrio fluvialis]
MNSFPFVAGQRTDKLFGSSYVLSPRLVKTELSKVARCEQQLKKNTTVSSLERQQVLWIIESIGMFKDG